MSKTNHWTKYKLGSSPVYNKIINYFTYKIKSNERLLENRDPIEREKLLRYNEKMRSNQSFLNKMINIYLPSIEIINKNYVSIDDVINDEKIVMNKDGFIGTKKTFYLIKNQINFNNNYKNMYNYKDIGNEDLKRDIYEKYQTEGKINLSKIIYPYNRTPIIVNLERLRRDNEQANIIQQELDRAREELDRAQEEFDRAQEEFDRAQEELGRAQEELGRAQEELRQNNNQENLEVVQQSLQRLFQAREIFARTQRELGQIRQNFQRIQQAQ